MNRVLYISAIFFIFSTGVSAQNTKKPNVLFIAVDDLRPELGCYGQAQIKSPNIDKLAESGLTFNRAYCNIPVCGASWASTLSGIRPNRNRFLDFNCWQDKDVPGVLSLPMHFKNNGYTTVSLGKIYHHITDGKGSWTETPWFPQGDWKGWQAYVLPESHQQIETRATGGGINGPSFESPDVPDQGQMNEEFMRKLIHGYYACVSYTNALIEYVDIYPSICELAGLSKPFHLQGKSFVPLTENPNQPWKEEVYCSWIRGETIVAQTHTYTEWQGDKDGTTYSRMLYDLKNVPEETINISEKPGNKILVQQLSGKLKKHILVRDEIIIP